MFSCSRSSSSSSSGSVWASRLRRRGSPGFASLIPAGPAAPALRIPDATSKAKASWWIAGANPRRASAHAHAWHPPTSKAKAVQRRIAGAKRRGKGQVKTYARSKEEAVSGGYAAETLARGASSRAGRFSVLPGGRRLQEQAVTPAGSPCALSSPAQNRAGSGNARSRIPVCHASLQAASHAPRQNPS